MAPNSPQPDTPSRLSWKKRVTALFSRKSKTSSSQDSQGSLHPNIQPRPTKSRTSLDPRPEKEQRLDRSPHWSSTRLTPRSSNQTYGQNISLPSVRFGSPLEPENRRDAEARAKETEADTTDETKLRTGRDSQMPVSGAIKQLGPKTTQEVLPHDGTDEKEKADEEQGFESDTATEPEPEDELGMESEGEDLPTRIHNNLKRGDPLKGDMDSREFLPAGLLVKYVTRRSVRKKLEEENPSESDIDDLVNFIVHHARKIFATLLLCFEGNKLCKAVRDFRNHRIGSKISPITDSFLPITEVKKEEVPFFVDKNGHWNPWKVSDFCTKQWIFLAPKLPPKGPLLKVDALTPLPFIEAELVDAGAFGEVHKVLPCSSNIREKGLKESYIAVKLLKDPSPKDEQEKREQEKQWTKEVKTHHEIQAENHDHIIDFIAAIERGKARYLLFSWADQGNLQSLWKNHPTPSLSSTLVEDVIRQLQGLADALDTLHHCGGTDEDADSSWRHGDIKPQNILSRSKQKVRESADQLDIGHLMMSDLGLAKRHDVATQVRNDRTSTRATTFRYSPPELHTLEQNEWTARSRRYDIWSMGCVILEFAIWLLYGYRSLEDFNSKITYGHWGDQCPWFEPGKGKTAKLHGVVEHPINFILENDPECQGQTALRELVELVRDKLLIVELGSQKHLQRTPSFRSGTSGTTFNPHIQEQGPLPTFQLNDEEVPTIHAPEDDKADSDSTTKVRAESKDVNDALREIIKRGEQNEKYWFTGNDRSGITLDMDRITTAAGTNLLSPGAAAKSEVFGRQAHFDVEETPGFGGLNPGSPSSSTMTVILQNVR
ncbi:hypothetical protein QBC45DRAFT_408685 [Copromyces sp. CBS 386.78]|nr:hypothetical protein QBC45DRAFT_408685 [Copromyces sp. CBS 386.78]